MYDTYKMQEHICKELEKKAESGIKSTSDLDTIWKLIDSYKNLLKIDMLQEQSEYSEARGGGGGYSRAGGYSRGEGYSERQRRDSRGRYSREGGYSQEGGYSGEYERGSSYRGGYSQAGGDQFERYMDSKQSYRSSKSPECKKRLMDAVEEYMDSFTAQMEEMLKDSDCREERETIKHYLDKIKSIA